MVVSDPGNFSLVAKAFGVNTVRTYAAQPAQGPAGYISLMNQAAAANVKVRAAPRQGECFCRPAPRRQLSSNGSSPIRACGCRVQ